MASEKFIFETLPTDIDSLKAFGMDTPFKTAALAIAALMQFKENPDNFYALYDFLKGPDSVSAYEKQFIKDRLRGKEYKVDSFFAGATPDNGYTPSKPYTIEIQDNPYSYAEENYATMHVQSSGADSTRPIKLRKKPSTGEWFVIDIQCLSDILIPKEADPWA